MVTSFELGTDQSFHVLLLLWLGQSGEQGQPSRSTRWFKWRFKGCRSKAGNGGSFSGRAVGQCWNSKYRFKEESDPGAKIQANIVKESHCCDYSHTCGFINTWGRVKTLVPKSGRHRWIVFLIGSQYFGFIYHIEYILTRPRMKSCCKLLTATSRTCIHMYMYMYIYMCRNMRMPWQ